MIVFSVRGSTVEAAHPIARGERYASEDNETVRYDRIYGKVVGTPPLSRLVRRHTPRMTSYVAKVGIGTSDGIRGTPFPPYDSSWQRVVQAVVVGCHL
jgi:hypothetical protein